MNTCFRVCIEDILNGLWVMQKTHYQILTCTCHLIKGTALAMRAKIIKYFNAMKLQTLEP